MKYAVLLSAIVLSAAHGADVKKTDPEKMQGVWLVEEVWIGGERMEVPKGMEAVIEKNNWTIRVGSVIAEEKCAFVLGRSAKLQMIDFVDGKGRTGSFGIYELKGETLRICMSEGKRPEKFASEEGSKTRLIVVKRQAK
jgi:uncharacterized protein (TIGR03067 family)